MTGLNGPNLGLLHIAFVVQEAGQAICLQSKLWDRDSSQEANVYLL